MKWAPPLKQALLPAVGTKHPGPESGTQPQTRRKRKNGDDATASPHSPLISKDLGQQNATGRPHPLAGEQDFNYGPGYTVNSRSEERSGERGEGGPPVFRRQQGNVSSQT